MARAIDVYNWSAQYVGKKDGGRNCTFVWDIVKPEWNCIGDWCAAFLEAGLKSNGAWYDCPLPYYVPSWENDAKKEGNWKGAHDGTARFMDAVIYGRGSAVHIEWFIKYVSPTRIRVMGGNTSSPSGSVAGGEGIWIKERDIDSPVLPVRGFVGMTWDEATPPPSIPHYGRIPFPLPAGHFYGIDDGKPTSHSGYYRQSRPKDWRQIAAIQIQVNYWMRTTRGFVPLKADGFFGPKTAAAVKWYQRARIRSIADHLVDGKVGRNTWSDLFR